MRKSVPRAAAPRYLACAVCVVVGVATAAAPPAGAGRPEPVPLYGSYDNLLDRSRMTFNGQSRAADPSSQTVNFTTTCDPSGCVAHWLKQAQSANNPNPPVLFDYQWVNDRWVSNSQYQYHCDDGSAVSTTRNDSLIPNGDGSFSGQRTFDAGAPGCPGDGPGTYQVPHSLTPS